MTRKIHALRRRTSIANPTAPTRLKPDTRNCEDMLLDSMAKVAPPVPTSAERKDSTVES